MIKVELREAPMHECTATLTIADDGTCTFDDPEGRFPTPLHVLVPTGGGEADQVRFEDDPATWAPNLENLLRTPYMYPVIVHDDGMPKGRRGSTDER